MSAFDVDQFYDYYITSRDRLSEFYCSVCGKVYKRKLSEELSNITLDQGKHSIASNLIEDMKIRAIWVCSEECKTTYTLQKE